MGVDIFVDVHDDMKSALHTAWHDHYGAKSLYMAEARLTSVEGRSLGFQPGQ